MDFASHSVMPFGSDFQHTRNIAVSWAYFMLYAQKNKKKRPLMMLRQH